MGARLIAAILDIAATLKNYSLIGMMGWQDVRHRYKRSSFGAFWLTISMGIMIGTMAIIFSSIFLTPIHEFLPYLAIGMIFWGYISATLADGCEGFVSGHHIIKQLNIPLFSHIARVVWRNIIILGHNLLIFPIILVAIGLPITWTMLLFIPGFLILTVNLAWTTLLLGVLCARYRDLSPIVISALQILFYLTPIMWMPDRLSHQRAGLYLVDSNPLYHLISIVRAPLLGHPPTTLNWTVSLLSALCGWAIVLMIFARYQRRIAYWL